jgi:hypothetical protein
MMLFLGLALAAAAMAAIMFVLWRAWRNGAWNPGEGAPYRPWSDLEQDQGRAQLVHAAILAANAHNTQPWEFSCEKDSIAIFADAERHIGSFDPFRREMHQSLGCALENLLLAARAQGLAARAELQPARLGLGGPPPGAAAIVRLAAGERTETELFRAIPGRHTHRGVFIMAHDISQAVLDEMKAIASEERDLRLLLLRGPDKTRLANLITDATQAIVGDQQMSKDNARWFRFHRDEVEQHRDGLTLDTNVTPPLQNFGAKIFPPSEASANRHWVDDTDALQLATAPLLGIIAVRDLYDRATELRVGRLWQRLHLLLTARGLAAQPLNQPIERMDRENELHQPPRTARELADVTGDASWVPAFIFRAGYPTRPAAPSPRRPVEAVMRKAA